ncbi:MAG: DeoR family transcriptional regulator, fructose operon transcriptional repressor [Kosmotogales bacterium]|nr:DeoR family transcriptional regulator, fructose operon transcriptional repressor [Kosmotogales bacterium]
MLTDERRRAIFENIKKNMSITTDELSNIFNVSPSTIRRDLEYLASKNLIKRTHKGAIFNSPHAEGDFLSNYNYMKKEKNLIAKKALNFINDKDFIALSGGTTSYFLAEELINSELQDLTLLTHSVNIAVLILESKKEFKLVLAGGIPRKGSYECVGEITLRIIKNFNIDKYFLGVNGVSLESGVSFANMDEAIVSQELIRRSKDTYVLADRTKFDVTKPFRISDFEDISAIITDDLSSNFISKYKNKKIEIY